jgi:uncharacterized protein YdaU (DUF1376 family)
MSEFPFMPLYWKDWLTGTGTTLMTAEQEGGFLNLLLRAWGTREPPCALPNDQATLAQLSKLGTRWKRVGPLVLAQFHPIEGTQYLRNRKQWAVYAELLAYRDRRTDASKVANNKRWGQHRQQKAENSESDPISDPNRNPNQILSESESDPIGLRSVSPASASASASADETDKQSPTDSPPAAQTGSRKRSSSASHSRKNDARTSTKTNPHAESAQAIVAHLHELLKANGHPAGIPSAVWAGARKKIGNALKKHPDMTVQDATSALTWAIGRNGGDYHGRIVRDDGAQNLGAIWIAWQDRDKPIPIRGRLVKGPPGGTRTFHPDDVVIRDDPEDS